MDTTDARLAFVGTYSAADSEGVYACRLDDAGDLASLGATATAENPTYLAAHPDGEHLYATSEVDDGAVVSFAVDRDAGALRELDRGPTGDAGPAHCAVDPRGEALFVAHYHGGSVAMLPVDDGRVGDPADVVAHEGSGADPERQTEPHPHSITPTPEGDAIYVPDLGTDELVVYDVDRADDALRPRTTVAVHDGAGPRHLDWHPDGDRCYLVNELDSTLTTLRRGPDGPEILDTASTLPDGFDGTNHPADVQVHPSGDWAFASNRGHDSVAVFELDADGRAELVGHEPAGGEGPRGLRLDPTGDHLLVANRGSGAVVPFRVDAETGSLSATAAGVEAPGASCARFVPSR